jgi:transcription elongation factor GreA
LEELKKELQHLKTARRMEVAERLKRAKELGDLSENAEYAEARDEQGIVESRIAEIEDTVRNASIIKHEGGRRVVEIGSSVVVVRGGKELRFTIVGSNETKPEDGFISNESPLGKAFLGKQAGEEAVVATPKGEVTYSIKSVD